MILLSYSFSKHRHIEGRKNKKRIRKEEERRKKKKREEEEERRKRRKKRHETFYFGFTITCFLFLNNMKERKVGKIEEEKERER